MRITGITFFCLFVLVFSCKQNQDENVTNPTKTEKVALISEKEVAALKYTDYELDDKTRQVVRDWTPFVQLQNDVVNKVKVADLSFFNDNNKAIVLLIKDLKKDIPEAAKSPSIDARILVVETKIYELESISNLSTTTKDELLVAIKDFLVSFSNLKLQLNKKIEFDTRTIEKP
ncbi:hypothetical protein KFZ70_06725 [Tamlana fucoidanivorans]|uniref:Lipoprotein n=1 Tax=Allotamlana fucoidanivorans TaxID=2583814 RepID=A0A5C4SMS4_9FLAO|nr:hypothetical protein [Tamlana fucoidanivorans]TNJ45295.1 hypothetical protein FGF67_06180 [Tamlana fucoidanivorans]